MDSVQTLLIGDCVNDGYAWWEDYENYMDIDDFASYYGISPDHRMGNLIIYPAV